ncbi:MAG TPA: hypothetical protein VN253_24205 [Kofleriaceae bacterium]|nr:hypothetical protein [Kofleriaceae bacterium]
MSGPKRNPDKLNSIGIVVVGICGAVLVYVSIVALQAFYMDDTSDIQTMADYGGQDTAHKSIRAQQLDNLQTYAPKAAPAAPKEGEPAAPQTYTISIDDAIRLVVDSAKKDPSNLVPANGPAVTPTVQPIFGRPKLLAPPTPAPAPGAPAPDGAATAPADGAPAPGEGQAKTATPAATPAAQPKATPAATQPKGTAPKGGATAPAQPKKGNAS